MMKRCGNTCKLVVFFAGIFLVFSSFQEALNRTLPSPLSENCDEDQMCDVVTLCFLMEFEEQCTIREESGDVCDTNHSLKKKSENLKNTSILHERKVKSGRSLKAAARSASFRLKEDICIATEAVKEKDNIIEGTIFLTGGFGKLTQPEIENMVNVTLEDLEYNRNDEFIKSSTIVTVMNKQEPEVDLIENYNEQILISAIKQHNLHKKIAETSRMCKKVSTAVPLIIRRFENRETGIKTMVVMARRQFSDEQTFANDESHANQFLNWIPVNLNHVGPKVFLENSIK